jgi:hypothetical protein
MYREIFLLCSSIGIEYCYAAMDDRFSRLLQAIGFPFRPVSPLNTAVAPPRRVYLIGSDDIERSLAQRDQRILDFIKGREAAAS